MEQWKAVPGYEGYYEVSDLGCVRSIARSFRDTLGRLQYKRERILKTESNKGYERCYLFRNSKLSGCYVHVLVWKAFKGEIPEGYQIDHKDDDKSNNKLSNLQPLTPKANRLKAVAASMDEQYHPQWGKRGSIAYNAGYAQALKDMEAN